MVSTIGSSVSIVRGSVNESTTIGAGTTIAHGTKIGHGTIIGENCHFANNVSTAGNSCIGDNSFLGSEETLLTTQKQLNDKNIFPRRYFYPSLNTLDYVNGKPMPVSEHIASRILCLPLYKG